MYPSAMLFYMYSTHGLQARGVSLIERTRIESPWWSYSTSALAVIQSNPNTKKLQMQHECMHAYFIQKGTGALKVIRCLV